MGSELVIHTRHMDPNDYGGFAGFHESVLRRDGSISVYGCFPAADWAMEVVVPPESVRTWDNHERDRWCKAIGWSILAGFKPHEHRKPAVVRAIAKTPVFYSVGGLE